MKNKIAQKLFLSFSCALLLFASIIGGIFYILFSNYTTDLHRQELEKRAVQISDTLAEFFDGTTPKQGSGSGAYMQFLDDIAMSDVWVVDSQYEFISWGKNAHIISYSKLPEDGVKVIESALTGTISFSESFSDLLGTKSTTVGAPIFAENGNTVGVVLLHAPVSDTSNDITEGLKLLMISLFIALVLAILVSYLLSLRFTRPLSRMKETAVSLAEGNYSVRSQIQQKDEIGELARAMDQMAVRLKDASEESNRLDTMRKEFTANISHELRTPVTVLRGSLEALCDGIISSPSQIQEYHDQMLKETVYLERLVNDLLELSRLQNPDFKIDMDSFNLVDLLVDVNRSIREYARRKQISVVSDIQLENAMVWGDYARLRQMLIIVLDNAIKFSHSNGNIYIELFDESRTYLLSVRDEGCGISECDLDHIFNRFHKTQDEQNKSGTGLGLAIAKQIATRHGIEISTSSRLNVGTCITFLITKYNTI